MDPWTTRADVDCATWDVAEGVARMVLAGKASNVLVFEGKLVIEVRAPWWCPWWLGRVWPWAYETVLEARGAWLKNEFRGQIRSVLGWCPPIVVCLT